MVAEINEILQKQMCHIFHEYKSLVSHCLNKNTQQPSVLNRSNKNTRTGTEPINRHKQDNEKQSDKSQLNLRHDINCTAVCRAASKNNLNSRLKKIPRSYIKN